MSSVTSTTRIKLPEAARFEPGDIVAIASAGGPVIGIQMNADHIGVASLRGGEVDARSVDGKINPGGRGSFWRSTDTGLRVETVDAQQAMVIPEQFVPANDVSRHPWAFAGKGMLIARPPSWPALSFVTEQAVVWTAGSGVRGDAWHVTSFVPDRNQRVLVGVWDGAAGAVTALALDTGRPVWRTAQGGQPLRLALSNDGAEIAALVTAPDECEACKRVVILSAVDGTLLRTVKLARPGEGTATNADVMGFSRGQLWFHVWARARMQDLGAGPLPERCGYDVYDSTTGALLRQNTLGCAVRAMLDPGDGTVLSVRVSDDRTVEVTASDGPP